MKNTLPSPLPSREGKIVFPPLVGGMKGRGNFCIILRHLWKRVKRKRKTAIQVGKKLPAMFVWKILPTRLTNWGIPILS
jgi:hypothetical protein